MSSVSRQTQIILCCIAALTILAWTYLVHLDRQMSAAAEDETMMAAMGMAMTAPWTTADVLFTFGMWAVMMIGMMLPSAAPVLLLAARAPVSREARATPLFFGMGYLSVWIGFSAIAALAQWALREGALLSPAMAASSPRVAGVILIGAGVYQLTPLKRACLTHCRSPFDFLMTRWRGGPGGAVRMGAHHGVSCLGCCWALMGVLFVVGVMNLAWVAALAAFVLLEKVAPMGVAASRIAGIVMMLIGSTKFVWNW
jgi:predicted metal-binding membrane protein